MRTDMADKQSIRGYGDGQRINVNQDHEVPYWSDKSGVSREQLRQAVPAVGPIASAVGTYLHRRSSRSHWREKSVG